MYAVTHTILVTARKSKTNYLQPLRSQFIIASNDSDVDRVNWAISATDGPKTILMCAMTRFTCYCDIRSRYDRGTVFSKRCSRIRFYEHNRGYWLMGFTTWTLVIIVRILTLLYNGNLLFHRWFTLAATARSRPA